MRAHNDVVIVRLLRMVSVQIGTDMMYEPKGQYCDADLQRGKIHSAIH